MNTVVVFSPTGAYLGYRPTTASNENLRANERVVTPEMYAKKEGLSLVDGVPVYSLTDYNQVVLGILKNFLSKHLDTKAKQLGYDSALTLLSWIADPASLKFYQEAVYFAKWRTAVTVAFHDIVNTAKADSVELPRPEDFLALLPAHVAEDAYV
jgi:hypothetical protein